MRSFLAIAALAAISLPAHAFQGTVIRYYVDAAASPGGSGSSWGSAFRHLQDGLDEAETILQQGCGCVVEIFVARGSYYPDRSQFNSTGTGDRQASFELLDEVTIYGHFVGFETSPSQRDLSNPNNRSILSGDIGTPSLFDNSRNVVDASFASTDDARDAVLDGFTIRRGYNQDQPVLSDRGAGFYSSFGRCMLANCTIEENYAQIGGGVSTEQGARQIFVNCLIRNNQGATGGGGSFHAAGYANYIQCVFFDNTCGNEGGGGMYVASAVPAAVVDMNLCTMAENGGFGVGDDIYARGNAPDLFINNSVFWSEDPFYLADNTYMDLSWSVLRGGVGGVDLVDTAVLNSLAITTDDPRFLPQGHRPATNSLVVDSGNSGLIAQDVADIDYDGNRTEALPLDLARNPRVAGVIDRGAYEAICATDSYCLGLGNSTGSGATLDVHGSCRVSDQELTLRAGPVPNQPGLFFFGTNQIQNAFGNGIQCVGGTIKRLPVMVAQGNYMTLEIDWSHPVVTNFLTAGTTPNFQLWYRDPAGGGAFFNLSDAVEVALQP